MTREAPAISKAKPANPGLDYAALRKEGIRLVQEMSGEIWTDYNASDPGVTLLEQLCYALTELSYRAGFPVEDLLAGPAGRLHLRRQGLYPARAILPSNPVTTGDLRRLILDRVEGAVNVWLQPCPPKQAGGVNGLYDIILMLRAKQRHHCRPCCADDDEEEEEGEEKKVVRQVLDCFSAHRPLCEDIHSVTVLAPIPVQIQAEAHIDERADPAAVLAGLLFKLGLRLAPEPKRQSLADRLAQGLSTADIFSGPLMLRGFIEDVSLEPLPGDVAVDALLQTMAETSGVVLVDGLQVRVGQDPKLYHPGQVIEVPEGSILHLADTAQDATGGIRLLQRGMDIRPNAAKVRRLLDKHWAAQRQTFPLWAEYAAHYAPPKGRHRDLAAYTSVQDQFPEVYGIGTYGLPPGATAQRRGQAKQLKGYLMVFDQLMADYFSQLAFIRKLFSIQAGGQATYAWQSLTPLVPDAAPLLGENYAQGLAGLVQSMDPVAARQLDILGLLLSFYAESLPRPPSEAPDIASVEAARSLLARLVAVTRDRGRGMDYRHPGPRRSKAGLDIKARIELELLDASLAEEAEQPQEKENAAFGERLTHQRWRAMAPGFMPIGWSADDEEEAETSPLVGRGVAAALLPALTDINRYRVGAEQGQASLVCLDMEGEAWKIGEYGGLAQAAQAARRLVQAAGEHGQDCLYVVEWTLLRFAQAAGRQGGGKYSFRLSAVLHATAQQRQSTGWKAQAEAILRANTPAHIALDCLFLDGPTLRGFRRLHADWAEALRSDDPERKAEASRKLEQFLDPRQNGQRPLPLALKRLGP